MVYEYDSITIIGTTTTSIDINIEDCTIINDYDGNTNNTDSIEKNKIRYFSIKTRQMKEKNSVIIKPKHIRQ